VPSCCDHSNQISGSEKCGNFSYLRWKDGGKRRMKQNKFSQLKLENCTLMSTIDPALKGVYVYVWTSAFA
jgi:hypothetical protein